MTARIDLTPAETRLLQWLLDKGPRVREAMLAPHQARATRTGETLELWGAPTQLTDDGRTLVPGVLLATVRP